MTEQPAPEPKASERDDDAGASFRHQWRWLSWVLLVIVAAAALVVGVVDDSGDRSDAERAAAIAATIRCPQCRGQSVAESNVSIAREIRADIARRVDQGQTDAEIRQAYIDRYDESIVLTPSGSGFVALVWVVPVVAVALGIVALGYTLARWRRTELELATDADRALVDRARAAVDEHPSSGEEE